MAAAKQIINISPDAERALLTYAERGHMMMLNQFSTRSNLQLIDRYYAMEQDWTSEHIRSRIANRLGDKHKLQDITVPVVMPQVRAALSYLVRAFLTGYPVFGVSSDPSQMDAALQMETIIAENAVTAGWVRELILFFRDGLKYNMHGVELEWQQKNVATIETDVTAPNGAKPKTVLWNGNVIKRMDMYNTFFDPRVSISDVCKTGEFAGYIELYSRVRLKQYINDLFGDIPVSTVKRAFESGSAGISNSGAPFTYFLPQVNPYATMSVQNSMIFDWMAWAINTPSNIGGKGAGIRYQNVFEVMTLYARIIPADFGLRVPAENTPQVWKFKIVNGQVVLFAERQSNAHNFIPIFFGQPLEDGLNFQTKSFAQNVMDMQDIASAMWNGYLASKRRLVGDRVLYDPLRIREKDINSTSPVAKIPVRPSAFGKPVGEAVYQFPFRDDATQSLLDGATRVTAYADKVNGQNPAQQGQFVKGNKTKEEFADTMGAGEAPNQLIGLMTEYQVFTPLKEAIKLNILQYQPETVLYNRDKNQQVTVKPEDLRAAAVHFKVSDGMLPEELQMDTDEFQTALQAIGSSPAIGASYNVGPLFTYLMKLRGADLRPFEKSPLQVAFEQQMQQWQQVAMEAIKAGQQPPPQPQMPPALQQELQQKAQTGGVTPSPTGTALEATQGSGAPTPATGLLPAPGVAATATIPQALARG